MGDEYEPPVQNFEIFISPWAVVGWALAGLAATGAVIGLMRLGSKR